MKRSRLSGRGISPGGPRHAHARRRRRSVRGGRWSLLWNDPGLGRPRRLDHLGKRRSQALALGKGGAMDRLACPCCGKNECTPELVASLARLEKEIGGLRVTSGYRCSKHNQDPTVKGRPRSKHLCGRAVDVLIPADLANRDFIDAACRAGFNGLGVHLTGKWAHLDRRSTFAM